MEGGSSPQIGRPGLCQGALSGEQRIFQSFLSAEAAGRVCRPGLKGKLSPTLVPAWSLLSLPGSPCSCVPRHTALPRQTRAHKQHTRTHTHTQDTSLGAWLLAVLFTEVPHIWKVLEICKVLNKHCSMNM